MKAVILAGGLGTRLAEETEVRPKPMVEIGGRPILWHIMKIYSAHGINDFVVCLGYKGYVIKEYLEKYPLHTSDVTFDMRNQKVTFHRRMTEPWTMTLIDTGDDTMTGGRIKRALPYVSDDEAFCMTYGDGVGDVDVTAAIALHKREKSLCTVTAVRPPGRFGALKHGMRKSLACRKNPKGTAGGSTAGSLYSRRRIGDFIEGRQHKLGARADGRPGGKGKNGRVLPQRLLASDGYAARQAVSGIALGGTGKAPWKIWKD